MLCCCRDWHQRVEVSGVGGLAVKARVRPSTIVEGQIPADRCPGIGDGIVGAKIDLLILDRPPEPFDKDVVAPRSSTVHADGDAVVEQDLGEGDAGELAPLVGVKDFGPAISAQSLLDRFDTEAGIHADREPP